MLTRETKLKIAASFTGLFFIFEIVVGNLSHSIALVADAFHMLSDIIAVLVALYAIILAKKTSVKGHQTYGWQRAEIIGALVNGIFLLALCFTLCIDSIQRFFITEHIENPKLVLIVGSIGLLLNVSGLFLFHEHAHSHAPSLTSDIASDFSPNDIEAAKDKEESHVHSHSNITPEIGENSNKSHSNDHPHSAHAHGNMNMRGLFLHIFGDALGSIGVIISALINMFTPAGATWLVYIDPCISLLIVMILVSTAAPLVSSALSVLLQNAPSHIPLEKIKGKVLALDGVLSIHEFHVWQLSDFKMVASIHVLIGGDKVYGGDFSGIQQIQNGIQEILHNYGVHNCTVQPEFQEQGLQQDVNEIASLPLLNNACLQKCPDTSCETQACCTSPIEKRN